MDQNELDDDDDFAIMTLKPRQRQKQNDNSQTHNANGRSNANENEDDYFDVMVNKEMDQARGEKHRHRNMPTIFQDGAPGFGSYASKGVKRNEESLGFGSYEKKKYPRVTHHKSIFCTMNPNQIGGSYSQPETYDYDNEDMLINEIPSYDDEGTLLGPHDLESFDNDTESSNPFDDIELPTLSQEDWKLGDGARARRANRIHMRFVRAAKSWANDHARVRPRR